MMIKKVILSIFLIIYLLSCQKIEKIDDIVLNYSELPNITLNVKEINIENFYEPKFAEPYIDHSLLNTPKNFLYKWLENNIDNVGDGNKLIINILDASLKKIEEENKESKKYEEKLIYKYEISYLVEYLIYNESSILVANSIVESKRATTSGKYLSINEYENILDLLIVECLIDFSNESNELLKLHMKDYLM